MIKKTAIRELSLNDLLAAERVLAILNKKMAAKFQEEGGASWPRAKMQQHVNYISALIQARAILLDRANLMKSPSENLLQKSKTPLSFNEALSH